MGARLGLGLGLDAGVGAEGARGLARGNGGVTGANGMEQGLKEALMVEAHGREKGIAVGQPNVQGLAERGGWRLVGGPDPMNIVVSYLTQILKMV
jgi:hypothetical protein